MSITRNRGPGVRNVVETAKDLPSPLGVASDAEFIVRDKEEIHGIDEKTKQWHVVASYAKHSTAKAADLSDHLNAKGNPHKTKLADAYAAGSTINVDDETGAITIAAKAAARAALLKLLSGARALVFGEEIGKSQAQIVMNGGRRNTKTPMLAVVDGEKGTPVLGLDGDGNLDSDGAVSFRGGWKGDFRAEGTIKAKGIEAPELLLKGASTEIVADDLALAVKGKTSITGKKIALTCETLEIGAAIVGDMTPREGDKWSLGARDNRWRKAAIRSLDIEALEGVDEALVWLRSTRGRKANLIDVSLNQPGDLFALTAGGKLGLGTNTPSATLDVRGDALFGKTCDFEIIDLDDAGVQLGFNFYKDKDSIEPELVNENQPGWRIIPGSRKRDYFEILRAKGGPWKSLLRLEENLAAIGTSLSVGGFVQAPAVLAPLFSDKDGKFKIALGENDELQITAARQRLRGAAFVFDLDGSKEDEVFTALLGDKSIFTISRDGSLIPAKGALLGTIESPWETAFFADDLVVGTTIYAKNFIGTKNGDFNIGPATGVFGVPDRVRFTGLASRIVPSATTAKLEVGDDERRIDFDVSEDGFGLDFVGQAGDLRNVGGIYGRSMLLNDYLSISASGKKHGEAILHVDYEGAPVLDLDESRLNVRVELEANGLIFKKIEEKVTFNGSSTGTKLQIPAGVAVHAVRVEVLSGFYGAGYLIAGDALHPDRFLTAQFAPKVGQVFKGLNHIDRALAVQSVEAPVVLATGVVTTGEAKVTVFYTDMR